MDDAPQSAVSSTVDAVSALKRAVRIPVSSSASPLTRGDDTHDKPQKLSFLEKSGYGAGDAAGRQGRRREGSWGKLCISNCMVSRRTSKRQFAWSLYEYETFRIHLDPENVKKKLTKA
jgi:hypothetical protein